MNFPFDPYAGFLVGDVVGRAQAILGISYPTIEHVMLLILKLNEPRVVSGTGDTANIKRYHPSSALSFHNFEPHELTNSLGDFVLFTRAMALP